MENNQFVTIPNTDWEQTKLELKDLVVYAYLRKHYNSETKEAHPSLATLIKESQMSKLSILKSLQRLELAEYIFVDRTKKYNVYTFSDINKFEIFSFDFLDNTDLSVNAKALLIGEQAHMFKNIDFGTGKMTFSDPELARKLNIDVRTLHKYEAELINYKTPILTLVPTQLKDPCSGLAINERVFDFEAYNNAIVTKFEEVDRELAEKADKKDLQIALQRIAALEKQLAKQEMEEAKVIL